MATVTRSTFSARTTCAIGPGDVSRVLCHRQKEGREQYLVQWQSTGKQPPICSWHDLDDLVRCLHHVQAYIEGRSPPMTEKVKEKRLAAPERADNRKRKSPDADPLGRTRDHGLGIPTPSTSHLSRSPSVISISSDEGGKAAQKEDVTVYNGVLERKEGRIVAKNNRRANYARIDIPKLPTADMLAQASTAPVNAAECYIHEAFNKKLRAFGKAASLRMENAIDGSTPSLDFTFVRNYILRDGVSQADDATLLGCPEPCRPDMGAGVGCEYTKVCDCLEYAPVDEVRLDEESKKRYHAALELKATSGVEPDTTGLPKRFPYHKATADRPATLQKIYREDRYPIYECNERCNCGPRCKSRYVQKGRKVGLTIFKTLTRGWGLKCDQDLLAGQFIDTYRGEVITDAEARAREEAAGPSKGSYLYSLDKFVGDSGLEAEDCYLVDGQFMGGPTRFINHSCEPNCRQYSVSYNKNDLKVYDLAFFAYEYIPAGTELTFDYLDQDEVEWEDWERKRREAEADPENPDKKPCNCGAPKCRGFLWT